MLSNIYGKFTLKVPGAPPQNVSGEAVSPTAIRVTWSPPPAERSNGPIVYYKLQYVEKDRSDSDAFVVLLNSTEFTLDELKRWTEYKIWVSAGTKVGDGPASYPIYARTHEDGMFFFCFSFLIYSFPLVFHFIYFNLVSLFNPGYYTNQF